MTNQILHFVTIVLAFFAVMNPIANAALFISLTDDLDSRTRRGIALRAVLLAFAIVSAFAIGGRIIFEVFGITLPAFRIAGGAIVGLMGYHMLHGEQSAVHSPRDDDHESSRDAALDLAVSPLALPILAGPGTIATAMNFAVGATTVETTRVLIAFGVVCAVTWATFLTGETLTRFLGQNAVKVITRLMGLILAVIGVQMIIEGVRGAVAFTPVS